jgi:hypothetical protein
MTVEPFTKRGDIANFVSVVDRHQPRVRGASVVFGGGLHDPLLSSRILSYAIRLGTRFPNWRNIAITLKTIGLMGDSVLAFGVASQCYFFRWRLMCGDFLRDIASPMSSRTAS